MKGAEIKILFLNQMAGPLFRELAEDVAQVWPPSILHTGHPHTRLQPGSEGLVIEPAPVYDRQSTARRLWSWMRYFGSALRVTARQPRSALLFIVSNPPFLGLLGLFFKLVRGQRYAVLVYDVYPDLLVGLGALRTGFISRVWTLLNRLVLEHASLVFTIGDDMARLLERTYDLKRTEAGHAIIVPNWADVETVRPRTKTDNPFAMEHGQLGKVTVLYSGNMGNSHDIESILAVARELKEHETIRFLMIGEGAKWSLVEKTVTDEGLHNITLLPFQPEDVVPFSMTAGDIGIVAYQPGTEECMVPSKTCYYMAAGLVPLVVSGTETDLSRKLVGEGCGIWMRTGDTESIKLEILSLAADLDLLGRYKATARSCAERFFSRRNTEQFVDALRKYCRMD
ncbi:MAG: hypothetical protein A2075_16580 [Geobacteraceae bacterium GWC2_58_44]|nr:MAG: hypothetical protein A2075_16580 [Geobacteraceae bacterium GWC2_58_44]HBG05054.1 hypothetical protein [Geobacter sp.]